MDTNNNTHHSRQQTRASPHQTGVRSNWTRAERDWLDAEVPHYFQHAVDCLAVGDRACPARYGRDNWPRFKEVYERDGRSFATRAFLPEPKVSDEEAWAKVSRRIS